MESETYIRMAAIEDRHWWFVARRRILSAALERFLRLPKDARILEAGCGTGGNLAMLSKCGRVAAFEPYDAAREMARERGAFDLRPGRLPTEIPFEDESFDLIAMLDVLEHLEEDSASLRVLGRRLKPGGRVLITVPAFPFLWSSHDEAHHHQRRYKKRTLEQAVRAAGLKPIAMFYFNSLLFPLIAGLRLVKTLLRLDIAEDRLPPEPINRLLTAIFSLERYLLGRVPMPFGVSLFMIAERAEGPQG